MEITKTRFPGVLIIKPRIFSDQRGYFYESYNLKTFRENDLGYSFIQDNQSRSAFGTIRGLHYQLNPYAQTKLLRVLEGNILDVAVDLRKHSPTFGEHFSIELSGENQLQILIPKGFAHGFAVLGPVATVLYKCDSYYYPAAERGIFYADPELKIDWKLSGTDIVISGRDAASPLFKDAEMNFVFET
jgi:dTDP-4-dehydrorhamnose 3,5-epimerase